MKAATKRITTMTVAAVAIVAMLSAACGQSTDSSVSDNLDGAGTQRADESTTRTTDAPVQTTFPLSMQATSAPAAQSSQQDDRQDLAEMSTSETTSFLPEADQLKIKSAAMQPMAAQADSMKSMGRHGSQGMASPGTGAMNTQGMKPTPEAVRAKHHGTNPFYDTDEDNLSTFSLDADTASYDATVDAIRNGHDVRTEMVRVEDFVNAISQGYEREAEISLHVDGTTSRYNEDDYRIVRVGVAPPLTTGPRPPTSVVFVIDTSGSMSGAPMATSARVAAAIGDQLDENDRTAIVGYGEGIVTTHMEAQPFSSSRELREFFTELEAAGSTPLAEAVIRAYQIATDEAGRDDVQHVAMVLISDGFGNVGEWEFRQIQETIRQPQTQPITLNTIAVVERHFDDAMMEALANNGNGYYQYVPTGQDLDDFTENGAPNILRTGPRDARIQVEFNPNVVRKYRLLGYENRRVADQDFRDDTLDFGEPGFQREATALYEIRLHDVASHDDDNVLTIRLRWRPAQSDTHLEKELSLTVTTLTTGVQEPDQHLLRTMAMAEFAEILRGSPWADCRHTETALQDLQASTGTPGGTPALLTVLEQLPNQWSSNCTRQ